MTASVTVSPRYASESRLSFIRTRAEISCGVYFLPSMSIDQFDPISRLTDRMVRSGLVTACRFATSPTSTSPLRAKATIDGVVREPSALAMTVGSPPSSTLTQEFVVPRSMPTARAMVLPRFLRAFGNVGAADCRLPTMRHQVEWTGLNNATPSHSVKSKLSLPDARSSGLGGARPLGTCPVTALRYRLSAMHRSGTLYP